jgi:Domain of unknown function (DUF4352)
VPYRRNHIPHHRLLVLALSMTALAGAAGPASAATKHSKLHCKHGYVKQIVTVKEHGHIIKVKVDKCVKKKAQAPVSKTISVTHGTIPTAPAAPAPAPTPAPSPAPAPSPPPTPAELVKVSVVKYTHINTANAYETPQTGNWFIAIELTLTNTGSETVSSNANLDTTVVGTNGQVYTAALGVERRGCTNFDYGDFTLAPSATEVGCVVFELPTGMETQKIQFELEGFVRSFS